MAPIMRIIGARGPLDHPLILSGVIARIGASMPEKPFKKGNLGKIP
jgi:hypothetical protein